MNLAIFDCQDLYNMGHIIWPRNRRLLYLIQYKIIKRKLEFIEFFNYICLTYG